MIHKSKIIKAALCAAAPFLGRLPADVANGLRLALSLAESPSNPTAAETTRELGEKWMVARRTVKFYSPRQYYVAQRRALLRRIQAGRLPDSVTAAMFPSTKELRDATRRILSRDVMENKMNQSEIQERMGSEATAQDAIAMMDVLTAKGYDLKNMDATTIPDDEWLAMIDEAATEYDSCGACDTVYRRETGGSRTSPAGVIDLCEDCNRRYVHYLSEHPVTFSLAGFREYVRN